MTKIELELDFFLACFYSLLWSSFCFHLVEKPIPMSGWSRGGGRQEPFVDRSRAYWCKLQLERFYSRILELPTESTIGCPMLMNTKLQKSVQFQCILIYIQARKGMVRGRNWFHCSFEWVCLQCPLAVGTIYVNGEWWFHINLGLNLSYTMLSNGTVNPNRTQCQYECRI